MPTCPITYEQIPKGELYSTKGLKLISPRLKTLEPLPYSQDRLRKEAIARADKMSIQGVQPKISARLNISKNCFDIVDTQGTFILKPQTHNYEEVPENEDLSMKLAHEVGILTPVHGLIYAQDNTLVYFIKRFDRLKKQKIAVEDFAQLAGVDRDTKYNYSMEKIISIIDRYTTFPKIERAEFFLRTLVNFIIGNEDMHLKNFSLITLQNKITLAPAYDFLNSTLALGNANEEIALSLNGKKRNLKKKDLIDYFAMKKLELPLKIIDQQLQKIFNAQETWQQLIEKSFLKKTFKSKYLAIVTERIEKIS